jgi:hypothetical protein
MTSKDEKNRRKELVRSWQAGERATAEAEADRRLPFSRQGLWALFRYVSDGWDEHGCDGTPRRAIEYLNKVGLSQDKQNDVLDWLAEQGGACDCEILANVADKWVDNFNPKEWNFAGDPEP